jgi:5-methylcytosine-specific restriction endonuclease McrA
MNSKVCKGCGVEKQLSEYYKHPGCKGGVNSKCKVCHYLEVKRHRQTDRGKEVRRKEGLRYRQTEHGKEVIRKARSKYYKTEKGRIADRRGQHKRRVKLKDVGTFTNEEWNDRLLEYNHCCAYCYKSFPLDELTVEHMIPLSRGGTNTIDNIVPSCRSCNSRKWTKTPLEMLQKGLM